MHRGPCILHIVDKSLTSIHDILLNVPFLLFDLSHCSLLSLSAPPLHAGVSHVLRLRAAVIIILRPYGKAWFLEGRDAADLCCRDHWSMRRKGPPPCFEAFLLGSVFSACGKIAFFHKPTRPTLQASSSQYTSYLYVSGSF